MNKIKRIGINVVDGRTTLTFTRQNGDAHEYTPSEGLLDYFDRANDYGEHPKIDRLIVYTYPTYVFVRFDYQQEAVK